MTEKIRDLFPIGNDSVVSVDGRQVDDGNIIDQVIGDDGLPSYLSRNHMAVALERASEKLWWFDGHRTDAEVDGVVSLNGDTFYVYRFADE